MNYDLVLVGGGLQNALVALAALARHPDARIAMVEAGPELGGSHTWSFHAGDLSPRMAAVVEGLVVCRWPAYQVAFPGLERRIDRAYASITSARLHAVLVGALQRPGCRLLLGARATEVRPGSVALEGGERLAGSTVVDARGPSAPAQGDGGAGFQKFLGLELELLRPAPGRLALPMIMDARLPQEDGFRFMYALPLARDRILLEDTLFSDGPDLDEPLLERRILAYAGAAGLATGRVLRRERGVLPLPLAAPRMRVEPGLVEGGYRGGWFHPTTGYSLPAAARLAEALAEAPPGRPEPASLARLQSEHVEQARFFALLNRLLFRATPPAKRWNALARFHRLPEETVERFYAMRTRPSDRARILLGRPPRGISLWKAMRELRAPGGGA